MLRSAGRVPPAPRAERAARLLRRERRETGLYSVQSENARRFEFRRALETTSLVTPGTESTWLPRIRGAASKLNCKAAHTEQHICFEHETYKNTNGSVPPTC